jgi:hypothetical protein
MTSPAAQPAPTPAELVEEGKRAFADGKAETDCPYTAGVNAGIKMHRLAGVKMLHGPDATTAVFSGTGKPGACRQAPITGKERYEAWQLCRRNWAAEICGGS